MTASRVAVIGLLVAAALLVALVVLGGNGAHEYKLVFQNAGQIVNGDDVKIGGRPRRQGQEARADGRQPRADHGRGR